MHYSKEKPSCSTFRVIYRKFSGVRKFRIFMVICQQITVTILSCLGKYCRPRSDCSSRLLFDIITSVCSSIIWMHYSLYHNVPKSEEHSDQGLHCLLFCMHLLNAFLYAYGKYMLNHRSPQILDTRKFAVITLKVEQDGFS